MCMKNVTEGRKCGRKPVVSGTVKNKMIDFVIKRSHKGIGFSKSNFLRFRQGSKESTPSVRHDYMTRQRMARNFHKLGNIIQSPNLKDHQSWIWNMDETEFIMFHKTNKVLARKGSKMVHRNVSLSREFITVIVCGNPNGNYLPPHIVFPEKKKRKLEGCDLEVTLEERIKLLRIGFWVDERWHR